MRWRTHSYRDYSSGPWRYPGSSWVVDSGLNVLDHPYYYNNNVNIYTLNCVSYAMRHGGPFPTYQAWVDYRDLNDVFGVKHCFAFYYSGEVQIRYVMIQDYAALSNDLDDLSISFVTPVVILDNRPQGSGIYSLTYWDNATVKYAPWGTCTTPSVAEATVNFNMVFASAIPNPYNTTAERDFTLTLRNCPRTRIRYYFHANGKWVDSSRGIVGMQGSTSNYNPVIGNPRGFGIQLQHGTGNHQHSGSVYIHPNEINTPTEWNSYTRTWPGLGAVNTSTGVTHTIPLRARVIRTSPTNTPIVPGPFNTSVVFVIHYP